LLLTAVSALAQESYTYTVTRTRTLNINWLPEQKSVQRYTVGVNLPQAINNGFKFDFEYELPRPGRWLQTSLIGYIAPERNSAAMFDWNDDGNNRYTPNSAWDDYRNMWGIGSSLLYKHFFGRRGWYFSTGLVFEFYRVGVMNNGLYPYTEDGLTFYETGYYLETKSYFKPTAQINIGKHFALSRRCFFDLFIGLSASYSFFKNDDRHIDYYDEYYTDRLFDTMYGFAYRGLNAFNGGFRFGVLLWNNE
jgi:hypothetical protein